MVWPDSLSGWLVDGAGLQQMFCCLTASTTRALLCMNDGEFGIQVTVEAAVACPEPEHCYLFLSSEQVIEVSHVVPWVLVPPLAVLIQMFELQLCLSVAAHNLPTQACPYSQEMKQTSLSHPPSLSLPQTRPHCPHSPSHTCVHQDS